MEVRPPEPGYIAALRGKYSRSGTRVLIYSAPFPDCDPSYDYYSEKLAPLADNRLRRFPIHMFNEQNHFTLQGATLNSSDIGADIAKLLSE